MQYTYDLCMHRMTLKEISTLFNDEINIVNIKEYTDLLNWTNIQLEHNNTKQTILDLYEMDLSKLVKSILQKLNIIMASECSHSDILNGSKYSIIRKDKTYKNRFSDRIKLMVKSHYLFEITNLIENAKIDRKKRYIQCFNDLL